MLCLLQLSEQIAEQHRLRDEMEQVRLELHLEKREEEERQREKVSARSTNAPNALQNGFLWNNNVDDNNDNLFLVRNTVSFYVPYILEFLYN